MRIDITDLHFGYDKGADIIGGIDLTLEGPGLYSIIGPNGVGKSTLVKCINGLLKPRSGSVYIDGTDVSTMDLKALSKRIAFVPAGASEAFSLKVIDAILLGCSHGRGWKPSRREMDLAYKVMDLLDIEDLAMHDASELSAGQHQKLAIARGLIQGTDIIILDEPTSNLDIRHQVFVTEMLQQISKKAGKMIIMISHDINMASRFSDRVIVMTRPGVIYDSGDSAEVITEEMMSNVYGVGCEIMERRGRPLVIVDSALPNE